MSTKRKSIKGRSRSTSRTGNRKSSPDSGNHTALEYSPASDDEGEFETLYYPAALRERSHSMEALITEGEIKKRRKIHRLSGVTVARFPQHYEDHGDLLRTAPPAATFDKKLRYSREAHVKHCHWKPKKKGPDMVDAIAQASLKGPSYSKLAEWDQTTRDAKLQCFIEVAPVIETPSTRDAKVQCFIQEQPVVEKIIEKPVMAPAPANNYDDLLLMLKGLKQNPCPGPHIPEGMIQQVAAALTELAVLLKALDKKSVIIEGKENDIMALIKNLPGGSNISEEVIKRIMNMLKDIHEFMKRFKQFDDTQLIDFLNSRINQLQVIIQELKKDHADILRAIETSKPVAVSASLPDQWMKDIHGFLLEILSIVKTTTVETTYMEPLPAVIIGANCTCSELVSRNRADPKFLNRNFLPGLCQRCMNDHRGREFLKNLNLPSPLTTEIMNLVGNIIQSIMDDNEHRVKVLLTEFKNQVPSWSGEDYQICLEALLHLSLIWDRQVSAQYIVTLNNIPEMYKKIANNRKIFNLCDFVKSAAEGQNPEVVRDLLKKLSERERVIVINSPAIYGDKRILSVFEAARRGDVKCFEILVDQGAELDLLEGGERSILHELVRLSDEKDELESAPQWEKTLYNMLDIIYIKTSKWWERYQGKSEYSDGSSASRKSALQYLFLHVRDRNGLNVLEFCAERGTRYMMRKIINGPPFAFLPDPFAVGYHSGEIGYLMNGIDSAIVSKGPSVLERVISRKSRDAGPILRLEPFKSLVEDKWKRYKPFFFILLIGYLAYMCIFTACAFTRPEPSENTFSEMYNTRQDWARLIGEIFCLVFLPLFLYGEVRDAYRGRWKFPRLSHWFGLFRYINVCFFILVIVIFILRCLANDNEDAIFSVCLLLGWMNTIQFLSAYKSTGIFPIVMHKIVRKNIIWRFLPAYILVMMAFSSSSYVNYQYTPSIVSPYHNDSFLYTPLTLFKMTFALHDAEDIEEARVPAMGVLLFLVFVVVGVVVMFYLLLASTAETFRSATKKYKREWIFVRAAFSVYIETRLPSLFYISYDPRNGQRASSIFGNTHMKYVVKLERKRNRNGGVLEVEDCVVMLPREDPPIPERLSGETKTTLDVEDVYRKDHKSGMLAGPKVTPRTDLTVIDLTAGQTNPLYESLGMLESLPEGPPGGKTVLHGAHGAPNVRSEKYKPNNTENL